jgi:ABC-2 type transport system ATP-binding protein
MSSAIDIEALTKTYHKRKSPPVQAVVDLSLAVPAGQVFGFLGANGAGKTTTIKMICGLIAPTHGHVRLNGHDVARARGAAMRQIGAVLEGTRNIYWRLSAWENLMYFGRLKGQWGAALEARAGQLLRELDLWERRRDPVREFSRGMQQKVAIACALVADPPIVLLDEPTLGLDVQAARTVKTWVERLAHEQNKTVVLTTHQLDMAQEVCDRVAIMSKGRLIADQPVSELLGLFRQEFYQIRLKGHLNGHRPDWLTPLSVAAENGDTLLSGTIADQDALHQVLGQVRELGLPLLSVTRAEPNLEEVFVRLSEGAR